MLRIGLTGGIGSGKSTVARVFETLGIPVFYADVEAKKLIDTSPAIKQAVTDAFGTESYTATGLNRPFISKIVFGNKEKLELLNSITHPAIIAHAKEWFARQQAPYVIKEAALLFESGSVADVDKVIGVYAPLSLRISRTMHRDHTTREQVLERMRNQINEDIKMRLCDYVITNNEQQLLLPQALKIHTQLLTETQ